MTNQKKEVKVLVLGGNGFIGSQVVANLAGKAEVTVGTRNEVIKLRQLTVHMQAMLAVSDWESVLNQFDVVINCVGILRQRKNESYNAVHNRAVAALAQACALLNVKLVHVSAIGLSEKANSRFIRTKLEGERSIVASGAKAVIVRPSLLDGEGGYGAKWFRQVASWPVQFVMKTEGLVAPLQVTDLGEAIAKLAMMSENKKLEIVELGGKTVYTIPEYLTELRRTKGKLPAVQLYVPKWLVRMFSHVFDIVAWTPLSFGHYELMQGYNVPCVNLLPKILGRAPAELGGANKVLEATAEIVALRS